MNWVDRFLERLGQPKEAPSYEALAKLCRAHLTTLPFENISKLCYFQQYEQTGWYIPPIETYVANLHDLHVGGTCFTNNSAFCLLLQQLGYQAELVRFDSNHLGVSVQLPTGWYYVDVGVGSPVFAPIAIPAGGEAIYCGTGIRLLPKEDGADALRFQHITHGEVTLEWELSLQKGLTFDDFSEKIKFQNTPGQTFFMNTLRCKLWQPDRGRSIALVNNTLMIRTEDGVEQKSQLPDQQAIEEVIAVEFGLPKLPVREAISVLESLDIDIFAPPKQAE